MKDHVRIYHEAFSYTPGVFISCEITEGPAVDIHHIDPRKKGGDKSKDRIEELMALIREKHNDYGDRKCFKSMLYRIHKARMKAAGVVFDEAYVDAKIEKYLPWENEIKE